MSSKPRYQDPVAQESKQKVQRIQVVQASQLKVRGLADQFRNPWFKAPCKTLVTIKILVTLKSKDYKARLKNRQAIRFQSKVGCYLGMNFVGALAYADDIIILAPSPSAMRILLQICDSYAAEYDINFNSDKPKFIVIPAHKRRHLYSAMCNCSFDVGNKKIDNVDRFSHLGHIITSSLVVDNDDIVQRRNTFVGQTSNVGASSIS